MFACPICQRPCPPATPRCPACGADLYDPEVRALAGASQAVTVAVDEGTLTVGKFLGVTQDGLASGRALTRLGVILGALLVAAFFIPASQKGHIYRVYDQTAFEWVAKIRWEYKFSWELLTTGPKLALLAPLLLGLLGLAAALVPKLDARTRGAALAVIGLLGAIFCLGPLGVYGLAPRTLADPIMLGMAVVGTGLIGRLLDARARWARMTTLAGAALVLVGYVIPYRDLAAHLPAEFKQHQYMLGYDLTSAIPLQAIVKGISRKAGQMFLLSLFLLVPLVLAPSVAALAQLRPRGAWDSIGVVLRPLGWVVVLFVPLLYGLFAFNVIGWGSMSADAAVLPRLRLALLGGCFFVMLQFGAAAVASWVASGEKS